MDPRTNKSEEMKAKGKERKKQSIERREMQPIKKKKQPVEERVEQSANVKNNLFRLPKTKKSKSSVARLMGETLIVFEK